MRRRIWAVYGAVISLGFAAIAGASAAKTNWTAQGHYYETCACKVSCPCATNQFLPNADQCDAVMLFDLDKASVGKVKLDGARLAIVARFPKNKLVMESFSKGELDHFAVYIDDKLTDAQRAVVPQLMDGMFGKMDIKGAQAPAFVPIAFTREGDMAKTDIGKGMLTADLENIKVGETKHGAKITPQYIEMHGVVPFPWMGTVTQAKSKSFHYVDGKIKWDYKDRNAYFGTFTAKGALEAAPPASMAAAPAKPAMPATAAAPAKPAMPAKPAAPMMK